MSLIEELADRPCERLTSREGCLADPGGYPIEEQCMPCRARAELGRPKEAPRQCALCGARLVSVNIAGGIPTGIDEQGSHTCPPPLHSPKLFYDETTQVRHERERLGAK